jgi:hypothetical protein
LLGDGTDDGDDCCEQEEAGDSDPVVRIALHRVGVAAKGWQDAQHDRQQDAATPTVSRMPATRPPPSRIASNAPNTFAVMSRGISSRSRGSLRDALRALSWLSLLSKNRTCQEGAPRSLAAKR